MVAFRDFSTQQKLKLLYFGWFRLANLVAQPHAVHATGRPSLSPQTVEAPKPLRVFWHQWLDLGAKDQMTRMEKSSIHGNRKWTLNEDVFPIEHGDFPASYVSLPKGKIILKRISNLGVEP